MGITTEYLKNNKIVIFTVPIWYLLVLISLILQQDVRCPISNITPHFSNIEILWSNSVSFKLSNQFLFVLSLPQHKSFLFHFSLSRYLSISNVLSSGSSASFYSIPRFEQSAFSIKAATNYRNFQFDIS